MMHLVRKNHPEVDIKFFPMSAIENIEPDQNQLILISQGLSPNSVGPLAKWDYKNIILMTAVTENNKNSEKKSILLKLQENQCSILQYPMEDEYTTLVRIVGPMAGYYFIYRLVMKMYDIPHEQEKTLINVLNLASRKLPKLIY